MYFKELTFPPKLKFSNLDPYILKNGSYKVYSRAWVSDRSSPDLFPD